MNRRTRLIAALVLLAIVWPAFANALLSIAVWATAHPAALVTTAAVVLLAGTVPGPIDRALTRLAPHRPATPAKHSH